MPFTTLDEAGADRDAIESLRRRGYLEVIEDDGEPTLVVTEAGRELLRP